MTIKFEWENISYIETSSGNLQATARAKVFNGWIVKHGTIIGTKCIENMVFLSDPAHAWKIDKG